MAQTTEPPLKYLLASKSDLTTLVDVVRHNYDELQLTLAIPDNITELIDYYRILIDKKSLYLAFRQSNVIGWKVAYVIPNNNIGQQLSCLKLGFMGEFVCDNNILVIHFGNDFTIPQERKKGINTALTHFALANLVPQPKLHSSPDFQSFAVVFGVNCEQGSRVNVMKRTILDHVQNCTQMSISVVQVLTSKPVWSTQEKTFFIGNRTHRGIGCIVLVKSPNKDCCLL